MAEKYYLHVKENGFDGMVDTWMERDGLVDFDTDDPNGLDTDKLIAAVEKASGEAVFQDSYGDGVAMVKGTSYATYSDLAEAFNLEIEDFYV
jgi:hypothetical protein